MEKVQSLSELGGQSEFTRGLAFDEIEKMLRPLLAPTFKSIRIGYCPLDKKGDLVNLVLTIFPRRGIYEMRFPKKYCIPVKRDSREEMLPHMEAIVEKIAKEYPEFFS